jgi:5-hydroxyisourate hydrolase-like protein (transthyretin family)
MRSSAHGALPAVLVLLCFSASVFAQSPAKQPAAKPTGGSVSGRVSIKDKPAGGIMVSLRKNEGGNPYDPPIKAITEQDGTYRITSVPPGSYLVFATTPAHVPADFVMRKSVIITEDENVEEINFSLVRGGVITGKVTNAEGRPVIQLQVELYRVEDRDQKAPAQGPAPAPQYPYRTVQTDDRGIYRMFGLMPGRYRVSAGRSESSMMQFSVSPIIYAQVFHPDAKDPAKATLIEVSEGSEATNVDITLGPTMQMFAVSGRIINSDNGTPVPGLRFGLHRIVEGRTEYINANGQSDARGNFTMEGVTPGKYGVYLFASTMADSPTELRAERTTFDVIDQDVTGVVIKLAKGASVTGVLVLESDDKTSLRKLLEMRLMCWVESYPGTSSSTSSRLGPDGSFRLSGLSAGMANFQIFPVGGFTQAGFVIVRLERDGVAMPQLEVKDGESVTGVRLIVRSGNTSLRGVVSFENGTPPPGVRVVIRLSKPGEGLQYVRNTEADSRGQFLFDNLPAGVYELRPAVFSFSNARVLDMKKEVVLTEGSVTHVTLTIDVSTLKL